MATSMAKRKVKNLVVDSGAFIRNAPINDIAENVYTLSDVVCEIRDKATRQRLQVLPYKIIFKEPTTEIIKLVTNFSKKTGDYQNLSATDVRLLALTYMLEKEFVGVEHLHTEPQSKQPEYSFGTPKEQTSKVAGFYMPSKISDVNEITEVLSETEIDDQESNDDFPTSSEDLEDGGWITPQNISEVKKDLGVDTEEDVTLEIACITADFAMQNVLKQIGLNVIGVDGMLIKNLKTYVFRCYACFKITSKMTSKFCPRCGNHTLKRVAVSMDDEGKMKVNINIKKPLNSRGTRFSIPMPRGGKHSDDAIIFEDQPLPQQRLSRMGHKKTDIFNPGYEVDESPFALKDVHSRAVNRGVHLRSNIRSNPNANKRGQRKR